MVLFKDRFDAGKKLAQKIVELYPNHTKGFVVLGIPRGGIAVGYPVAKSLSCPLEPVTVRKLPIPWNDQVGFGAVTINKEVILNEELLSREDVPEDDREHIINEVYKEVVRRDKVYRGDRPFPALKNTHVIIVDDGLATGYTMLAAIRFVREKEAGLIMAALPVAHYYSYHMVRPHVDDMVCLYIDEHLSFAVASFYREFPDMEDREVIGILKKMAGYHTALHRKG